MQKTKIHQAYEDLVGQLKSACSKPTQHKDSYGGNEDQKLHLRTPTIRKIAKDFIASNQDLATEEWVEFFHLFLEGKFAEEKQLVGKILENNKELRKSIDPKEIEKILAKMAGWSQVDSVCQSVFGPEDVLTRWEEWRETIKDLAESSNPNKKRASLVLLTAPVRQSTDERLAELSFEIIDKLKSVEGKLITKAISWLLREMIKNHRGRVEEYLENNKESLPAVAVRETENKLKTGRK